MAMQQAEVQMVMRRVGLFWRGVRGAGAVGESMRVVVMTFRMIEGSS